jgi:hypothetical protein
MSGGRFDYDQNKLQYLAEDIQEIIERNNPLNPGDSHSPEIIARYKEAAYNLERTYQMVQRIDWLESCDDGPESFIERWDAEVPPSWEASKFPEIAGDIHKAMRKEVIRELKNQQPK